MRWSKSPATASKGNNSERSRQEKPIRGVRQVSVRWIPNDLTSSLLQHLKGSGVFPELKASEIRVVDQAKRHKSRRVRRWP